MTLQQRVDAFKRAYMQWPASWPWLVREQDRDVLYAVWVLGNDYRNKTRYYGAYPAGFLDRVMALFPDVQVKAGVSGTVPTLHAFAGSLPPGPYVRLDVQENAERGVMPDVCGNVYDAACVFAHREPFDLVLADPPYSSADAVQYDTAAVDRRRATAALAQVTRVGGHLAWLDTCWPMHRKAEWATVGRILVQRSTNHRVRVLSLFERVA